MNLNDIAGEFAVEPNVLRAYFDADPEISFGSDSDELSDDTVTAIRQGWAAGDVDGSEG